MKKPPRWVVPAAVIVVGGLLVTLASLNRRSSGGGAIAAEGQMPAVNRATLQGGRVSDADFRGRPVLVNFWASWCAPCREEQPGIQRLAEELEGDVAFLGVNFKNDVASAKTYLEEFDVSYPSVADPDGLLAHEFGVPYLPATILVDKKGKMRFRLVGAQTETSLRRHLEALLAE